jgi:hypothetical protein
MVAAMHLPFSVPRIRLSALLTTLVAGAALVVAPPAPAAPPPDSAPASTAGAKPKAPGFRVASLNLKNTMSRGAIARDINEVIREARPSVIGFQERGGTRRAMRAALPAHWALRMPTNRAGTDLNPIAFNKRVWKPGGSWPIALATKTWRRNTGKIAIDQYGVVSTLRHRHSGHVIRAISFHMPSEIHNRRSGGPNWHHRDRVEAFWRMAGNVRDLARSAPKRVQFIAMCDCNVNASRDLSDQLVRGRISGPLRLESNYSAGGRRPGWQVDYVLGERRAPYRIVNWQTITDLNTDHPAVITKFRKRR